MTVSTQVLVLYSYQVSGSTEVWNIRLSHHELRVLRSASLFESYFLGVTYQLFTGTGVTLHERNQYYLYAERIEWNITWNHTLRHMIHGMIHDTIVAGIQYQQA